MINAIRTKMGPVVIGSIIAVIAAVFIFFGIYSPSSASQGQSVAGEVNGETISYSEFSKSLNQKVEMYKNMLGGKISDEMLSQMHINESVFNELVQKKILSQMARQEGFYPSNEQIRDQILKMEAFKKDGVFNKVLYRSILNEHQYTDTRFEDMIGTDIMNQNFQRFIAQLAYVSNDDVEKALRMSKDRKKFKFVYVDNESARKMLPKDLAPAEQGKKLDEKIASLTDQILPALSSGSDAKINALLKDQKITVKTSDWLNAQTNVIPTVGSLKMIENDLFSMKKGDPAKKFTLMGGTFYAQVQDQDTFDASKISAKERQDTMVKLESEQQQELFSDFVRESMKKASISRNDRVVVGNQGQHAPVTADQ